MSQITGLIDRGHDVEIYADRPGESGLVHEAVAAYNLHERTFYVPQSFRPNPRRLSSPPIVRSTTSRSPFWNRMREAARFALMTLGYQMMIPGRRRRYDIVQCHFGGNGRKALALMRGGILSGRLVTTFHAYDINVYPQEYGRDVYHRLFRRGDLFTPISGHARSRLIELGCSPDRTVVHRMGVDPRGLPYRPRVYQRQRPVRILSVGRLVEKKGIEYALRSIGQLSATGYALEYQIVGDGPDRVSLERLSHELGIEKNTVFSGALTQDSVREAIYASDIFLLPSITARDGDQEGIPVALMEAMSAGMPVIATDYAGIPELVEHGISGFLVAERDVESLSWQLKKLIDQPEAWPEMGSAGHARIEAEYNVEALNDLLVERYRELIRHR